MCAKMFFLAHFIIFLQYFLLLMPFTDALTGERAVRLVRFGITSQSYTSGIVQIYNQGSWGNICNDFLFGLTEANVICHQLSYSGATSFTTSTEYGTDFSDTAVEDVSCLFSDYLSLSQCTLRSQYSSTCSSDANDLVVFCQSTRIWDNPYEGQIRLINGDHSNEGLLEVYCNGEWGTVCDDGFDGVDAQVACRQLGYRTYYDYDHLSLTGSDSIWYTNLACSSSSFTCLSQCQPCRTTSVLTCFHFEDITLDCGYSSSDPAPPLRDISTCAARITISTAAISTAAISTAAISNAAISTATPATNGGNVNDTVAAIVVGSAVGGSFTFLSICICVFCLGVCAVAKGKSKRRDRPIVVENTTRQNITVNTTVQNSNNQQEQPHLSAPPFQPPNYPPHPVGYPPQPTAPYPAYPLPEYPPTHYPPPY